MLRNGALALWGLRIDWYGRWRGVEVERSGFWALMVLIYTEMQRSCGSGFIVVLLMQVAYYQVSGE